MVFVDEFVFFFGFVGVVFGEVVVLGNYVEFDWTWVCVVRWFEIDVRGCGCVV